jgi:hypothetical protein
LGGGFFKKGGVGRARLAKTTASPVSYRLPAAPAYP